MSQLFTTPAVNMTVPELVREIVDLYQRDESLADGFMLGMFHGDRELFKAVVEFAQKCNEAAGDQEGD